MGRKRIALVMQDEALDVIEQNAVERKRGEFVSNVLIQYANSGSIPFEKDELRVALEAIDKRLQQVERKLDKLISN